ncbi:methyltransferase domain-containing protein [Saccharopolyspora spinosa]|uniref:Protein-L-isoaspartate O-methyltransferase n=1 Tax=Saccharopolyspora spinosa TaxID=60894 RepID=A0A2N3XQQ7_SACSN|nr:methyltransferase domain-containing protein [Saccharopolyspora spinosa]PKW13017.1 protein-L-isoaspartate O-methyltransferase [Saccharopolyspora spinosa]
MRTTARGGDSALIAELQSAGQLSTRCGSAFRAVAREWFVPDRMWVQEVDGGPYEPMDRSAEPQRWLHNVHSNRVIVTQFDDGATSWPEVGCRPTCSASMPSAVAGMLDALDISSGQSVLEIGTGTGYNAALLAELVGVQGKVTTIEIDADLAATARARLEAVGYGHVAVVVGDAAAMAVIEKFDRVIATAGVRLGQLPVGWLENARIGGVILAPMRADLASGPLVRFEVERDGVGCGHAVQGLRVGFMELRSHRVAALPFDGLRWDDPAADRSITEVSPFKMLIDEASRWAVAVAVPSCRYSLEKKTPERDHGVAWLSDPVSGSWASVVPDNRSRYTVRQSGPRRLWDEAEAAFRWWQCHGEPSLEAWRWTVAPDRQTVALA